MPFLNKNVIIQSQHPLTVAVIGHRGRMGSMLSAFWLQAGYTVRGFDLDHSASGEEMLNVEVTTPPSHQTVQHFIIADATIQKTVCGAHIVVLCVPVTAIDAVMERIAPFLSETQIVIDVTSVKVQPLQHMEKWHKGPVVGTHPLFGPVASKEELVVVLTPGACAAQADIDEVRALFTCFSCRCMISSAEEHDRGVAYAQALNFVSNAVYFATVAQQPECLPFLTPSFRRRIAAGRKQMTDDADMFLGFIAANPMMSEVVENFKHMLAQAEAGNLPAVVSLAQYWYKDN